MKRRRVRVWVGRVVRLLVRRPWLPAGACAGMVVVWWVSVLLSLLLMSPSRFRFLPNPTDELVLFWDNIDEWIYYGCKVTFWMMWIAPAIVLLARRLRSTILMLVLAALAWGFSYASFHSIPLGIIFVSSRRLEVARMNVFLKREAQKQGWAKCPHFDLPMLEQYVWTYDNERYELTMDSGEEGGMWLRDMHWQKSTRHAGLWRIRELLRHVIQWMEVGRRLYLIRTTGERYILDYERAEIFPYPDNEVFPENEEQNRIFDELSRRPPFTRREESYYELGGLKFSEPLHPPRKDISDAWPAPAENLPGVTDSWPLKIGESPRDEYGRQVFLALCNPNAARSNLTCRIDSVDRLAGERKSVLMRYLAAHPGWRVRVYPAGRDYPVPEGTPIRCAERRICPKGDWLTCWLDGGWEGELETSPYPDEDWENFELDFSLIFEGDLPADVSCRSGETIPVEITYDEAPPNANCFVACRGKNLTVYAREGCVAYTAPRTLQTAYDFTEQEFARLSEVNDWAGIRALLPTNGIRRGESSLTLYGAHFVYLYSGWVNPGEPGDIYLKAFEVSTGTPLSQEDWKRWSRETVGWSDDLEEKFCISGALRIMEGDGRNPYAARFEVWFVPDAGGPERKLYERVFKVKGMGY